MKTKLPKRITTIEEAKSFLTDLHNNGESFDPETSPINIEWHGVDVSDDEMWKLDLLMNQINSLEGFDPCMFILTLDPDYTFEDGK